MTHLAHQRSPVLRSVLSLPSIMGLSHKTDEFLWAPTQGKIADIQSIQHCDEEGTLKEGLWMADFPNWGNDNLQDQTFHSNCNLIIFLGLTLLCQCCMFFILLSTLVQLFHLSLVHAYLGNNHSTFCPPDTCGAGLEPMHPEEWDLPHGLFRYHVIGVN